MTTKTSVSVQGSVVGLVLPQRCPHQSHQPTAERKSAKTAQVQLTCNRRAMPTHLWALASSTRSETLFCSGGTCAFGGGLNGSDNTTIAYLFSEGATPKKSTVELMRLQPADDRL